MNDDDPTPRYRPRRLQTAEDRDLASARARRDRAVAPARGVPINQIEELDLAAGGFEDPAEITSPTDLFLRDLDDNERKVARDLGVDPAQPAPFREVIKLVERLNSVIVAAKRSKSDTANQALRALEEAKQQPIEQMSALERSLRRMKWVLVAIAIPAVSSATIVVKYVADKATTTERERIEREMLLEHDRDHEQRIRALEFSRHPRIDSPDRPLRLDPAPLVKEPVP